MKHHCTVLVGDKVYIIGGHRYSSEWEWNSKKIFSISIFNDGSMSNLSDMNTGRSYHGCASFRNGNKTFIAVAGGRVSDYFTMKYSTEIYDI